MKIYMLLDRSGSMASKWGEAIGSINGYAKELAKKKTTKKAKATLAVFDALGPFDVIRKAQRVSEWKDVTNKDAVPRGGTPLYDAVGKLIALVDKDKPKAATIVIVTDGYENSSREVSHKDAKAMLDRMRKKGFDVVFLGADFDAFAQSGSLGVAVGQTLNVKKGNYGKAMEGLAARTTAYASTGDVVDFTDQERAAAAGES